MKPEFFISALLARYRLFLLIVLATVLTATAVSLLLPKTYFATVSVLLEGADQQSLESRPAERDRHGYLQTQVDILTGLQVARRVVTDLKLAENPETKERFQEATGGRGSIEDWLAKDLLTKIKVMTTQSGVVSVRYGASDPERAARVVNALAAAYVDTVLKLRTEPTRQASAWFDEQLKTLRANLENAHRRLADYQREKGIISADERYDLDSTRFSELVSQVARSQGAAHEAINTELVRAEQQLREMSTELGQRHPQYLRQQSLVGSLRERVASGGGSFAVTRQAGLTAALESQRQRVLQLKQARSDLAMLTHDVDIAQRTYDAAMQRQISNQIESRASQTAVSVLDQAVPANLPDRPRVGLNILLSLIVGLLLAATVVFVLERFDRRVRWLGDLESNVQVPFLVVLNDWRALDGKSAPPALPYNPVPRLG